MINLIKLPRTALQLTTHNPPDPEPMALQWTEPLNSHSLPRCFHQHVSARCDEGLACSTRGRIRLLPNLTVDCSKCFHAWPGFHIPESYLHGLAAAPCDLQQDAVWKVGREGAQCRQRHITLQRKHALLIRRPAGGIDCKLSPPNEFMQTGHSHLSHSSRNTSQPGFAGKSIWPPARHKLYNLQDKEASHRDANCRKAHRTDTTSVVFKPAHSVRQASQPKATAQVRGS